MQLTRMNFAFTHPRFSHGAALGACLLIIVQIFRPKLEHIISPAQAFISLMDIGDFPYFLIRGLRIHREAKANDLFF